MLEFYEPKYRKVISKRGEMRLGEIIVAMSLTKKGKRVNTKLVHTHKQTKKRKKKKVLVMSGFTTLVCTTVLARGLFGLRNFNPAGNSPNSENIIVRSSPILWVR